MDAMSDAIEGAEVLLYGVSLKYKESASEAATTHHGLTVPLSCVCRADCRLEANYAHQQELDMIPLMMQEVRRLLPPALSGLASSAANA